MEEGACEEEEEATDALRGDRARPDVNEYVSHRGYASLAWDDCNMGDPDQGENDASKPQEVPPTPAPRVEQMDNPLAVDVETAGVM